MNDQQNILRARLNIARVRLANYLTHNVESMNVAALAHRRTEYDQAHEDYNNFLDDRICEVISNSGVLQIA